jgi:TPR repeat protein
MTRATGLPGQRKNHPSTPSGAPKRRRAALLTLLLPFFMVCGAPRALGADAVPPVAPSFAELFSRTEHGDAKAGMSLGTAYREASNPWEAARWWRWAAERGDLAAITQAANCFRTGSGVPRNLRAARALFTKAAEQGDEKAQAIAAEMALRGVGGLPDYEAASKYFQQAAAKHVSLAQRKLGEALGYLGRSDEAYLALLAAVENDEDSAAEILLAQMVCEGKGIKRNLPAAVEHVDRYLASRDVPMDDGALDTDIVRATHAVALYFQRGDGMKPDEARARQLLEREDSLTLDADGEPTEQTDGIDALFRSADALAVAGNQPGAVKAYTRAESNVVALADRSLGVSNRLYLADQDTFRVLGGLHQAAKAGSANARYVLAKLLIDGQAQLRDTAAARELLMAPNVAEHLPSLCLLASVEMAGYDEQGHPASAWTLHQRIAKLWQARPKPLAPYALDADAGSEAIVAAFSADGDNFSDQRVTIDWHAIDLGNIQDLMGAEAALLARGSSAEAPITFPSPAPGHPVTEIPQAFLKRLALGALFYHKSQLVDDPAERAHLIDLSAEQGWPAGLYAAARRNVTEPNDKALMQLELAAAQGHERAMAALAAQKGTKVPNLEAAQDEALAWWDAAYK